MKGIYKDLTGWHQPNGRWTVIERGLDGIDKHGNKYVQWWCQCDCGGERSKKLLRTQTITSEVSKSCGCWNREIHKDVMKKNKRYERLTEEQIKEQVEAKGNQFISAEYILKGGKYRWQICIVCKECNKPYTTMWDSYKNKPGTCPECSINNSHREQRLKKAKENNLVEAYLNILNLWDYDKNEDIPENYSYRSNYDAHYTCNICGHPWHGRINTIYMKSWSRGLTGCAACAGQIATPETCIAATHPYLVDYFIDKTAPYRLKKNSNTKEDLMCPICGTIKKQADIPTLTKCGFSCPSCGDKASFPERFMFNVLISVNANFEYQKVFSWSKHIFTPDTQKYGDKKYDFYLLDFNIIVETHGRQHKDGSFERLGGKTAQQKQENDNLKRQLAEKNGCEMIWIDCFNSEAEYIRNNILQSKLNDLFDFSDVDWEKVTSDAYRGSIVKQCAELFNQGLSTDQIANVVKRHKSTVRDYLQKATKFKWCQYSKEENMKRNGFTPGVNMKHRVYCHQLDKWFDSIKQAKKETGAAHISSCVRGARKHSGYHPITGEPLTWKSENEQYIERESGLRLSGKPIYCLDTDTVYRSITKASIATGASDNALSYALNHQSKCNDMNWCFIYDQIRKDGTIIPGAITLGLLTEEDFLNKLNTQQND